MNRDKPRNGKWVLSDVSPHHFMCLCKIFIDVVRVGVVARVCDEMSYQ